MADVKMLSGRLPDRFVPAAAAGGVIGAGLAGYGVGSLLLWAIPELGTLSDFIPTPQEFFEPELSGPLHIPPSGHPLGDWPEPITQPCG
jgi:hypothetical protein